MPPQDSPPHPTMTSVEANLWMRVVALLVVEVVEALDSAYTDLISSQSSIYGMGTYLLRWSQ